ncbi:Murein DD-endopeptidase MepM [Marinomonas aquimarina]|uniref:Murein DD-endopeptidase MepM n=1 Tax=Marinomonas aquimarina TaxID=295068 RepID=A0A1A8SYU4_9GAMM|nr:peptidoglycan DD-metalloendopeptidase family protein [Marinomonas aquimarina]SBS24585.1 Murein DD-endopeptidase MepM [Marinomonas aquimarina]
MDKSLLSKSLLGASFTLLVVGAGLLLWPTSWQSNAPVAQSSPTRQSAGPIADKADVPSPEHLQERNQPQTLQSTTALLQAGDSLSRTLNRLGVNNRQIAELLQVDEEQVLSSLKPGQRLTAEILTPANDLQRLTLSETREQSHVFTQTDQGFRYQLQITPMETLLAYKEVVIQNSLFVDGVNAGLSDKLLAQVTDIFRWDIDFALDVRKGDRFALLFEEKYIDGEKVATGNIIAAQFVNNGRVFEAIRYQAGERTDYFTRDGLSLRRAFIRSPVDFTRVSSQFNPNRLHPIFKTTRPHQGVDYAAPTNTPVQSAGDGKVSFVGEMKGYGNTVIIDHGQGYTTLYAHLNGFTDNLIAGRNVSQGETIAYVGQTGWATGPHLHYEFRINGAYKNPETVDIPYDSPMSKEELMAFLPYAQILSKRLRGSHSRGFSEYLARLDR